MLAFLCKSLKRAQIDISTEYHIMSTNGQDRGEIIYKGETVPFRIVTCDEQLRGLRLKDFVCLGYVSPRMIDIARAMIR